MKRPANPTHAGCGGDATAIKSKKLELPQGYTIPKHHHGHGDTFTTIREAAYRGKAIRIETAYKITIDDQPVTTHTMVLDDGTVHCHAFPNYSFPSAIDMAKKIVDASGIAMPKNELGSPSTDSGKHSSTHHGDHHGGHH